MSRYRVIYADPPWRFETYSPAGRNRCPDWITMNGNAPRAGAPRHYETMRVRDLAALPVTELAADDCVLLLWAIDPMLPAALHIGAEWGFSFKTVGFYWTKTNRDGSPFTGLGYWTRGNPEQCLLFTRGAPKRSARDVRKLIQSPRREHSRKPDEVYERIERLVAGPYVELFARTRRPGWDVAFSNEPEKFAQRDPMKASADPGQVELFA